MCLRAGEGATQPTFVGPRQRATHGFWSYPHVGVSDSDEGTAGWLRTKQKLSPAAAPPPGWDIRDIL